MLFQPVHLMYYVLTIDPIGHFYMLVSVGLVSFTYKMCALFPERWFMFDYLVIFLIAKMGYKEMDTQHLKFCWHFYSGSYHGATSFMLSTWY